VDGAGGRRGGAGLPAEVYPEESDVSGALLEIRDAVAALPGIRTVGGAVEIPLATGGMDGAMEVEGRPEYGYADYRVVVPGYFEALDIPVVEGRDFDDADAFGAPQVAVVNRSLASEYWPDESPIGQRIRGTTNDRYEEWMVVVGVVEDVRHSSILADPQPELYASAVQRPNRAAYTTLAIEVERDPAALAGAVREAIRRVAPQVPAELETYESIAARDIADRRFTMVLISGFALVALLLAAIGIYGVVSYTVGRRTREIGIRIALGAEPGRVVLGVQRDVMIPVALGAVVGVAASVFLSRVVRGLLFGVDPLDIGTFAAVTIVLLAVAAGAAYVPARRSARVDPVEALAAE
jgi:predicted permease